MNIIRAILHGFSVIAAFCRDVLFGIAVLTILAGLGVFLYQLYTVLRHGAWTALPLARLLEYLTPLTPWIEQPQAWFGLHQVITGTLASLPLGVCLLVAGLVVCVLIELCDASAYEYQAMWRLLNMPFVLFVMTLVAIIALLHYWDARQTKQAFHQTTNRYALETLYRLDTLLYNVPDKTTMSPSQRHRVDTALQGGDDFAPLFREFDRLSLAGLLYHLTLHLPHERVRLQGIRQTIHQLEELLMSPAPATSLALSSADQQARETLRTQLTQHKQTLHTFLRN
jgi:hypothetical protein